MLGVVPDQPRRCSKVIQKACCCSSSTRPLHLAPCRAPVQSKTGTVQYRPTTVKSSHAGRLFAARSLLHIALPCASAIMQRQSACSVVAAAAAVAARLPSPYNKVNLVWPQTRQGKTGESTSVDVSSLLPCKESQTSLLPARPSHVVIDWRLCALPVYCALLQTRQAAAQLQRTVHCANIVPLEFHFHCPRHRCRRCCPWPSTTRDWRLPCISNEV